MSALKIAIVILIVIAILFVTGIMAGRRKDTGDSDNHSDKNKKTWVDTVQGLLPASKKVKATEITGPCLRGDTIQVLANSPCALEIAKSGSFVRTLAVSLAQPPGPAAVNAMALQG